MSEAMKNRDEEELQALREEARHWQREAKKARKQRDDARARADGIKSPLIEVVRGETYWRVVVNGMRIDGYEEEGVAETVANRLRKAFEVR